MNTPGLNLGRIPFPADYLPYAAPDKRRRKRCRAATRTGAGATGGGRVGPMFRLPAGDVDRPLHQHASTPTVVLSVLAHGVAFTGLLAALPYTTTVALPQAPGTMMAFVVPVDGAPPPPPAVRETRATATADPLPVVASAEAPVRIAPERSLPERSLIATTPEPALAGVGWGIEGGIALRRARTGLGARLAAAPASRPPPSQPIRTGGAVAPPGLIRRVEPVYPPAAVALGLEGIVILEATVDERGNVRSVRVLRSVGLFD